MDDYDSERLLRLVRELKDGQVEANKILKSSKSSSDAVLEEIRVNNRRNSDLLAVFNRLADALEENNDLLREKYKKPAKINKVSIAGVSKTSK